VTDLALPRRAAESLHKGGPLDSLLSPKNVAVIGASRRQGSVGHQIMRNLLAAGFQGPVYPVNPRAQHVAGVAAYPTIEAVPGTVDLAVVCVPAPAVVDVARSCASSGVKAMIVVSAGFAECGEGGAARQRELASIASEAGMRLVGPNCLGVVNTDPTVSLAATFATQLPSPGNIALLSQSGAVAIGIVDECRKLGLGLSNVVSVGNKADVSGNDLLEQWGGDQRTKVVLLYLESFGNPRKFATLARRVARTKPIIAVKSGRSAVGGRAAASHSAALASSDVTVDALFRQSGVIRVDTVAQMLDVARLVTDEQLPRGCRVAVVGNSGGPGIMVADACEAQGLDVVPLAVETQGRLRTLLGPSAGVANPVDLTAAATPAQYERALECVLADDNIDSVIVVHTPLPPHRADVVAAAVSGATMRTSKTVVTSFLAADAPVDTILRERHVANYATPEAAAFALGKAVQLSTWRRHQSKTHTLVDGTNAEAGRSVVEQAISERGTGWLDVTEAAELLRAYGIDVVENRVAPDIDSAVDAAAATGYPVVLKTSARHLLHKTEVGGVQLGIRDERELREAFERMQQKLGSDWAGAVVQPMLPAGVELILGALQDPSFGPLVLFGSGGINTEVLGDVAARLAPLTRDDAVELVRSIRGYPLLTGHRGMAPVDQDALATMLCRLGRLIHNLPEVVELDCNPVIAGADALTVVDVKVRVSSA
jgi:acetyl coenzyme A synthetase (ADP forming)-like protein